MPGNLLDLFEGESLDADQFWAAEQAQSQTVDELLECFHGDEEKPSSPFSDVGSPKLEPILWDDQVFNWGAQTVTDDSLTPVMVAMVTDEPSWPQVADAAPADEDISFEDSELADESAAASHTLVGLETATLTSVPLTAIITPIPATPEPLTIAVADPSMVRVMEKYDLSDHSLTELSVSQLQKKCRGKNFEFDRLKQYRRTCLNRHYARNSRTKRQTETESMQSQLDRALAEMEKLKAKLEEMTSDNKALNFENELLKSMLTPAV